MLRISFATNLALHAMGLLAVNRDAGALSAGRMAGHLGVSEHHLAKVLQRLARARLVRSRRGPRGGFVLARPADGIRLLDVYEAMEGPLPAVACLLEKPICDGRGCLLGDLLGDLRHQVEDHLTRTTLDSFAWPHLALEPAAEPAD